MTLKVKDLILEILQDGIPIHPYGVYREIRDRHQRKVAYSTCLRVLQEILEEGRVRKLSGREVQDLGLQVASSPSGRSGWRPPIPRSYYRINE